jgi:LysR family nitrogen assimilation transcriptional regulator
VRVEIDALSQMKSLVHHGIGHTILPWHAVREEVARGELIATPIVEPSIDRTIYVAQASDRPSSPATTATIAILTDCLRELLSAASGVPSIKAIPHS